MSPRRGGGVWTNPDFCWGELNEPFPQRCECEVRVCVEIYDILTLLRNRFVITSMLLCLYCLISSLQTDNKLTLLSIFWKRRSSLCFEDPTVAVWFHIWRWLPPMYAEPWRRRTRASPTCCWLPGKTRKISLTLLNPAWDQVWAQQLE